jgi:RHS repeat-associated protein
MAAGVNQTYYYDVFGRITKEVQPPDSSTSPTKSYAYIFDGVPPEAIKVTSFASTGKLYDVYNYYDGFGNIVQIKQPADGNQQVVKNLFYDGLGRVIREQNPYFDPFSADLSAPSVAVSSSYYNFDPLGRVVSAVNPDGTSKTISFNRNTITAYDENGHRKAYILDAYGRITKVIEYNNNPEFNQSFETAAYNTLYAYDTTDILIMVIDTAGNAYSFVYDSLGRKIATSDPDLGNITYTYDLAGNLITQKQQGGGNLVSGDNYYREYDTMNELIRIRNGTAPTSPMVANYTYDPFGQRIKVEMNDTAKTKIYTPFPELMRIVNKTGTFDYSYIYQDGYLVARVNPDGSKYYYHSDHLGSTSLITDKNGNVVENTSYSPYGEILSGGKADVKLYTDQFKDFSCQYYYGARYYNPCWGMFTQPDQATSLYNPQSLNRYSYGLNNPYRYKDDSGHIVIIPMLIAGGIGAGVGFVGGLGYELYANNWDINKVNWGTVGVSTGAGFVTGFTFGLGTAVMGTGLGGMVAAGAISGVAGGQTSIAGGNVVAGRPVTQNLFRPEDVAFQAGTGAVSGAVAYGAGKLCTSLSKALENQKIASSTSESGFEINKNGLVIIDYADLLEGKQYYHDTIVTKNGDFYNVHGTLRGPQINTPGGGIGQMDTKLYKNYFNDPVQPAAQTTTQHGLLEDFIYNSLQSFWRWLGG